MLAVLFALSLSAPSPFEDIHKRFTIDLPDNWRYAPIPGDAGAAFRRVQDGLIANFNVQVLDNEDPVLGADALAEMATKAAEREPGYRAIERGACVAAGFPCVRRKFSLIVSGDLHKLTEERVVITSKRAFILHAEALESAFKTFEKDFGDLFASWKPIGAGLPQAAAAVSGPLIAKWAMVGDEKTIFELKSDGSFDLAGNAGTFRIQGARLLTLPEGGEEESFDWRIDGGILTLSGKALGEPIRYKRMPAKKKR